MRPFFHLLLPLCLAAMTATSLQSATIAVTDSTAVAGPRITSGNLSTTISSWGLDGGNAVVVLFAAENGINVGATYGSESLTMVEIHDGDRHVASIGYLINPLASTADLTITATRPASRISHAYAIFSLSDVGSFADSDTRTSNGSLGYTTVKDGGYVFVAAENNNFSGPAPTISGGNIDLTIFNQAVDGNNAINFSHGDVATAGTYSVTVGGTTEAAALVAFEAIPEPSSLLLFSLGSLALLRRRRA